MELSTYLGKLSSPTLLLACLIECNHKELAERVLFARFNKLLVIGAVKRPQILVKVANSLECLVAQKVSVNRLIACTCLYVSFSGAACSG